MSTISGVPADGSWYNSITFRVPQTVTDGYLVFGPAIQYVLGGTNNKQLLRKTGGTEKVIANNIVSFQVRRQYASRRMVEIAIEAEKKSPSNQVITLDADFKIELRN